MADEYVTADGGTPKGGETSLAGEIGDLLLVVQQQLRDVTGASWPPSVMNLYVDYVLLEIVKLDPQAYPVEKTLQLNAGAQQKIIQQATTFKAISILDFICNMGIGGQSTGLSIISLEKNALDHLLPDWQTYAENYVVNCAVKDDRNPLVFYVFPPQPAGNRGYVKILISVPPDPITSTNTDFPFDPSYKIAFIDGMIWKCLSEETNMQGATAKSENYRNKFLQDLGLTANVQKQINDKGR